ncbi:hypothetical protein [Bradyrhizobium sp. LHD-71]|uniref:hypothetical protein n=1 Tax=Bradyrhizobium sp. LHD-71 TaxID=3072141 RepID=UPI00280FAAD4|nr:hypothetical protein [Bradyrhizobium sp. LHD-71]MDQ8726322.1 hypothetical protein [Bradyrhizobium sp. LHD-71]
MQWAWATTLDELWRSPTLPMWATLVGAAFFALVVLIVLLRADKTMANGALAVIALLAIGIASTATVRGLGTSARPTDVPVDARVSTQQVAASPALACLDGLAGESVEAACEKAVFGSADTAAAAVSYTAGQISRVIAAGNSRSLTPEQQLLRRTVERDRYGLVAQVVAVRERCAATDCPLFRMLTDVDQIKANMNDRLYDTLVARYSPSWNSAAAGPAAPNANLLSGVPAGANTPTGRPTSVDFANSAAIPPVSIMGSEPSAQAAAPAPTAAPKHTTSPASKSANAQAQAKRPSAPPATAGQTQAPAAAVGRPRVVAPVPFVPSQPGDKN